MSWMAERSPENVIEWLTNKDKAKLTFGQQKYISKIRKLAENNPDKVKLYNNDDGSIFATVPLSWIKISPPRKVSDEQREAAAERFRKMHEEKRSKDSD